MPFVPKQPEDRDYISCSRLDGPIFTEGREDVCTRCGAAVHVSRSSEALIRDKNLVIVCVPCTMENLENDPDVEIAAPTPVQLAELALYIDSERRRN